ncbi:hypothetical protein [Streptomyces sp. 4F14]|uniref:hypothetical protein n=1 Tax=Streptomyces sp. 4F14 TaxID=3394380 RepID=UPI003A84B57B
MVHRVDIQERQQGGGGQVRIAARPRFTQEVRHVALVGLRGLGDVAAFAGGFEEAEAGPRGDGTPQKA